MTESEPINPRRTRLWPRAPGQRRGWVSYGVVLFAIAVAFAVRFSLTPLIVDYDPFMFFAPAALISAWFGGIGPGVTAWILGGLVGDFFFTGPLYTFGPYGPIEITLLLTYSVETAIGIALIEALRRMGGRAQESAAEAHLRGQRLEGVMAERTRAEDALRLREQQLRLITNSLPVLISYIDKEQRYQFLNQQYEVWFDRPTSDAYGQHVKAIWGEKAYEEMREPIENAFQGRQVTYERWVEGPKGRRCNQITYVPHLGEGERVEGLFVLVNDVTKNKLAEEALQQAQSQLSAHAAELELRVTERTAKLKQTLDDMERLLYSVAHDLRGPLRAMEGFTTLLLKQYASQLDATGGDYARRVGEAASRMDRLILDLLAYGRLAHIPLPCARMGLQEAVDAARGRLHEQIDASGAEISIREPLPMVFANRGLMEEVVFHLLSNALKFVGPGVRPQIEIYGEEREATTRLWVSDNGIGIAPEHHAKIFRLFDRLHGASSGYPGTGVGLAIVAKAMERLGGQAGVESALGQGSRFWVELPKA